MESLVNIFVEFDQEQPTLLCEIMARHGSDKARTPVAKRHNYTHYYSRLFAPIRESRLRVFEVGIDSGASLRGWKDFFPQATVFGADIKQEVLFTEDRISTFQCDMTSPESIALMWSDPILSEQIDVIVDDGRHTPLSQIVFFEHSIHKLVVGGVYVIEDVHTHELPMFERKVSRWCEVLPVRARMMSLKPEGNLFDNNLIVFQKLR